MEGVFVIHCCVTVEKAMAPHSSTLAWKIPWTEEPGRLQSMGSLRVGHEKMGREKVGEKVEMGSALILKLQVSKEIWGKAREVAGCQGGQSD